jgi:hypothetical protein
LKQNKAKNFWKQNKANIRCISFVLVGSENEKKRERAKRISFRFEAKNFFGETSAPCIGLKRVESDNMPDFGLNILPKPISVIL